MHLLVAHHKVCVDVFCGLVIILLRKHDPVEQKAAHARIARRRSTTSWINCPATQRAQCTAAAAGAEAHAHVHQGSAMLPCVVVWKDVEVAVPVVRASRHGCHWHLDPRTGVEVVLMWRGKL